MKKITKEEKNKLPLRGRGHSSKFYREIVALKVGDDPLVIEAEEWKRKYPPTRLVRYIEKKYGWKYEALRNEIDGSWVIERMK